ncbi:hypothetical protein HPP92_001067 [Vanilla planifolia]|uniref:Uncharacterized protein n=1 Tax=Vanilla planifolia TaxID=51239 RepID=A0A835VH81_VANPL|nr:hypothetical protein HPP92_001067 [Vanilla planifolia]
MTISAGSGLASHNSFSSTLVECFQNQQQRPITSAANTFWTWCADAAGRSTISPITRQRSDARAAQPGSFWAGIAGRNALCQALTYGIV